MTLQKPRIEVEIGVPKLNSRTIDVILRPPVIEATWSRNSFLEADSLTITVSWKEGGVDPRWLRNASVHMWMWNEVDGPFDRVKHLRFKGTCVKAERKVSEDSITVSMTFHDFTSFFINMKPFPTAGMPEWSDTLETIWQKICDNTGPYIPATKTIDSSVKDLRNALVFSDGLLARRPSVKSETLGVLVPERFHDVAKPTPKMRTDAWAVWNYCLTSLSLISYIDRDKVVVTDSPTFFKEADSAMLLYGSNIHSFEESVSADISVKGVVATSYNPLTGQTLEAFYPPPGDERLKVAKAKAKAASKAGRDVSPNDASGEWIPFICNIIDPRRLQDYAEFIYDQQHRQEIEGTLRTGEMTLYDVKRSNPIDILSLSAGDSIVVGISSYGRQSLLELPVEERVSSLTRQGYLPEIAKLIADNIVFDDFNSQLFSVMGMEVTLGPETFDVEIKYHSKFIFSDEDK